MDKAYFFQKIPGLGKLPMDYLNRNFSRKCIQSNSIEFAVIYIINFAFNQFSSQFKHISIELT